MSVLVMRAVSRRNPLYLVAAIAAHTLLDAFAVWAVTRLGTTWTDVGVGVFAAVLLGITVALREPSP